MTVNTPCNSSVPQTRHDTNGYYCTQFSNNSFFLKFSCSSVIRNSFAVFVCGEDCAGPCFPDEVTLQKLNLTLYDGLLGGNGSCVALPGLPVPAQVQCAACVSFVSTTTFQTTTALPVTTLTTSPLTTFPLVTTPAGLTLELNETNTTDCLSCHWFLNNQGLPALSAYANLVAFGGRVLVISSL
jgi:hypothetical protein